MNKKYKGVIWTDHAIQRLQERNISQADAWYAFRRPDQSRYAKSKGAWIYYKTFDGRKVEVVAKKEDSEWIIISVWSDTVGSSKPIKQKRSLMNKLLEIFKI